MAGGAEVNGTGGVHQHLHGHRPALSALGVAAPVIRQVGEFSATGGTTLGPEAEHTEVV